MMVKINSTNPVSPIQPDDIELREPSEVRAPSTIGKDGIAFLNLERVRRIPNASETTEPVDIEKVAELKALLAQGGLEIPPEKVADAILADAEWLRELIK